MPGLNLSEWANIAEITASIVLVLSLVYVGLELDRNTKAVHSGSWQDVVDNLIELDMAEAASEEVSDLVFRGESSPANLTEEEWWRFSKFADSRLGQIEHAYLAKSSNTLGESFWVALQGYVEHTVCKTGYRQYWTERGERGYHPEFYAYVSDIISGCSGKSS